MLMSVVNLSFRVHESFFHGTPRQRFSVYMTGRYLRTVYTVATTNDVSSEDYYDRRGRVLPGTHLRFH